MRELTLASLSPTGRSTAANNSENLTDFARHRTANSGRLWPGMRFHVAREGAVWGEFEEQAFRHKVFSGEITPTDFYWRAGFDDWRPVSEFRVARKTDVIILDARAVRPPAIGRTRPNFRWVGLMAGLLVLLLIVFAFVFAGR
jgi:GYF domain 2